MGEIDHLFMANVIVQIKGSNSLCDLVATGNQWSGPIKSRDARFYRSLPPVSCSNGGTESQSEPWP